MSPSTALSPASIGSFKENIEPQVIVLDTEDEDAFFLTTKLDNKLERLKPTQFNPLHGQVKLNMTGEFA